MAYIMYHNSLATLQYCFYFTYLVKGTNKYMWKTFYIHSIIQKYLRYGYLSILSSLDTLQMRHVVFEKIMVSSINSNARYILIMAKIMRRI